MHRGVLPGKGRAAGWNGMIHLNIKPENGANPVDDQGIFLLTKSL